MGTCCTSLQAQSFISSIPNLWHMLTLMTGKRKGERKGKRKVASRESSNRMQEAEALSHAAAGNDEDDDAFIPCFSFGSIYHFLLAQHSWPAATSRALQWLEEGVSLPARPVGSEMKGINKLHVGSQAVFQGHERLPFIHSDRSQSDTLMTTAVLVVVLLCKPYFSGLVHQNHAVMPGLLTTKTRAEIWAE